ncbi:uncharacterized protein [Solanum tuberosum]|uniref:uncharacterized protein n=1 Tax=Solanum tuberosum TaxID=4113 RepID=UPI00073A143B|nr:PREDICTED: uncharacterized protein LOC102598333 [Solanum tuberosum]
MVDNKLTTLSYSTMGFTSSVSGFHSLTESNQKLLLARWSQVTSMHSQPFPVELGRFSGYNAVGWVLQAELCFDFYAISNAHKLHYVSSYFDGDALEWFHWMSRNNQLVDWKWCCDFRTAPLLHQWGFWLILSRLILTMPDNEVVMSPEGFAATTEAHLLNECSQQSNHKVFVDEQFDVTTFSSEGHSDLEDEVSEEVCDIQA